eukprot:scaffold120390_cov25-Tisochrysis_lutea.AAC.1
MRKDEENAEDLSVRPLRSKQSHAQAACQCLELRPAGCISEQSAQLINVTIEGQEQMQGPS